MSKVIAALDNSAAARPVLATAAALARLLDAELEAVHVIEDGGTTARAVAEAAGVALRTLEGPELGRLVAACQEAEVSAVVAGTRGTPAGRRPAGHVALALIRALSKPVVVVPPQASTPPRLGRILVPLDGTRQTAAALRSTIELARAPDTEVVVLHVLGAPSLPLFSDQPQHEAEVWTREFLARFCPCPDDVRLEVRVGLAEEAVLRVAAEVGADLIALGWSRDLSPGRAKVVRDALHRSDVPILLVPV